MILVNTEREAYYMNMLTDGVADIVWPFRFRHVTIEKNIDYMKYVIVIVFVSGKPINFLVEDNAGMPDEMIQGFLNQVDEYWRYVLLPVPDNITLGSE